MGKNRYTWRPIGNRLRIFLLNTVMYYILNLTLNLTLLKIKRKSEIKIKSKIKSKITVAHLRDMV